MKGGSTKQGRGRRGAKNGTVTLSDLMAAKKLAAGIGLEKTQKALAALAKLAG
ncbi:MAG: hypothetical protein KF708_24555 [Pirellulales bacterium]|nr:hypothetical protein [Pirellulales bacterium]